MKVRQKYLETQRKQKQEPKKKFNFWEWKKEQEKEDVERSKRVAEEDRQAKITYQMLLKKLGRESIIKEIIR